MFGNQSSRDNYSGSITVNVPESGTLAIVGSSTTAGRKIRVYSEGGLSIMGDTRSMEQ